MVDKLDRMLYARLMEPKDAAVQAVSSPENLSRFADRGFKTVDQNKVLGFLLGSGLGMQDALETARAAVEGVGGFVTSTDRGGARTAWRSVHEIWMVPENVDVSRAA